MQQPTQIEPGPTVQRVDETIVQPASLSQRILSQEEQVSRFDRWMEFLSAVVLALATVATAW
jgi:hypothetical protein